MYLFGASGHGKVVKEILTARENRSKLLWMIIRT
ncbi:MAG: hypothetical protein ACLU9X_06055 [Alistipes shahii]